MLRGSIPSFYFFLGGGGEANPTSSKFKHNKLKGKRGQRSFLFILVITLILTLSITSKNKPPSLFKQHRRKLDHALIIPTNLPSMNTTNKFLSLFLHLFLLATILWGNLVSQVETLNFNYPNFTKQIQQDFITTESSNIAYNAMQVKLDLNEAPIGNLSGRIWYKYPFKLWNKQRNITASFNSTFTINISPQADQWGKGLAFILSKESGFNPK